MKIECHAMLTTSKISSLESLRSMMDFKTCLTLIVQRHGLCKAVVMDLFVKNTIDPIIFDLDNLMTL